MKNQFTLFIVLFSIILVVNVISLIMNYREKSTAHISYYDGEGNEIPDSAIKLLVLSQFAHITKEENKYLDQYFYCQNRFSKYQLQVGNDSIWLFDGNRIVDSGKYSQLEPMIINDNK